MQDVPGIIPAEKLVQRAMANARNRTKVDVPLWAVVMGLFACGSTMAHMICEAHERDPDEMMPSVCNHCPLIEEGD